MRVTRSKTDAGHRTIPLNSDGMAASPVSGLGLKRSALTLPDHFVFPACENGHIDPSDLRRVGDLRGAPLWPRPHVRRERQRKSRAECGWRDWWLQNQRGDTRQAFVGFRFHDLRHQAITELAEGGASDATLMAVAGHLTRDMLEHYSHVRMTAKRDALSKLESGLMSPATPRLILRRPQDRRRTESYVTINDTKAGLIDPPRFYLYDFFGRGEWIRTTGLLVPNQALYQAEPRPESAFAAFQ